MRVPNAEEALTMRSSILHPSSKTLLPVLALLGGCAVTQEVPKDLHDAELEQVVSLARSGDLEAQHDLCYRFKYGRRAAKDLAAAATWCTLAAQRGADSSQVLLAEMYYNGQGVEKDRAQALRWYLAAASQKHPHALFMLYHLYSKGEGVPMDQAAAVDFLRRSAAENYKLAIDELVKIGQRR